MFKITYVLDNPEYCKTGYVILGLSEYSVAEDKKPNLHKQGVQ